MISKRPPKHTGPPPPPFTLMGSTKPTVSTSTVALQSVYQKDKLVKDLFLAISMNNIGFINKMDNDPVIFNTSSWVMHLTTILSPIELAALVGDFSLIRVLHSKGAAIDGSNVASTLKYLFRGLINMSYKHIPGGPEGIRSFTTQASLIKTLDFIADVYGPIKDHLIPEYLAQAVVSHSPHVVKKLLEMMDDEAKSLSTPVQFYMPNLPTGRNTLFMTIESAFHSTNRGIKNDEKVRELLGLAPRQVAQNPITSPTKSTTSDTLDIQDMYTYSCYLNSGGFGQVCKYNVNGSSNKRVAIKEFVALSNNKIEITRLVKSIRAEREMLRLFKGVPGIVQLERQYKKYGSRSLVLEYLPTTLKSLFVKMQPSEDKIAKLLVCMLDICEGLAEIHDKGYVHRDIKPDNLMYREENWVDQRNQSVIIDLGLMTKPASKSCLSAGTPVFMDFLGCENDTLTPSVDIFALGATFLELYDKTRLYDGNLFGYTLNYAKYLNSANSDSGLTRAFKILLMDCMRPYGFSVNKIENNMIPNIATIQKLLPGFDINSDVNLRPTISQLIKSINGQLTLSQRRSP